MTIDEAIEILTLYLPTHRWPPNTGLQDAMGLSIEALKRVKWARNLPSGWELTQMPGETD